MPRKPRFAPPGYPLHLTQRGNYRQPVFFSDEDRSEFLALLDHHADLRQVRIHGYAIMSNHIHLVVTGQVEDAVSRFMQHLTGQYAQYLHGRLNRRGRLWQSRFFSCVLDHPHFLAALAYVDLNPVRARNVIQAPDYAWSSAAAHSGLIAPPAWLDLETLHRHMAPGQWHHLLHRPCRQPGPRIGSPPPMAAALRRATRTETPLGEPGFVEALEAKFQIFLWPQPLGRPSKRPAQREASPTSAARLIGRIASSSNTD